MRQIVLRDTGERVVPEFVAPDDSLMVSLLAQHLFRYRLLSDVVKGKRVLDLGCGAGYGCRTIRDFGARSVLGIDVDLAAIAYAKQHNSGLDIEFRCGSTSDVKDEQFDVVVCFETLEHVPNPGLLLQDIRSLIKDDGVLYLSATVVETAVLYPYHLHDFTAEQLTQRVLDAGFIVSETHPQSFHASRTAVWKSLIRHVVTPRWSTLRDQGLHGVARIFDVLGRRGLTYENLTLVAIKDRPSNRRRLA